MIQLQETFWRFGRTQRMIIQSPWNNGWSDVITGACNCFNYNLTSLLSRFLEGLSFPALGRLIIRATRRSWLPVPICTLAFINTQMSFALMWHLDSVSVEKSHCHHHHLLTLHFLCLTEPSSRIMTAVSDSGIHLQVPSPSVYFSPQTPISLLQLRWCSTKMCSYFLIFYYIAICAETLLLQKINVQANRFTLPLLFC